MLFAAEGFAGHGLIELDVAVADAFDDFGSHFRNLLSLFALEAVVHEPFADEFLGELFLGLSGLEAFSIAFGVEIAAGVGGVDFVHEVDGAIKNIDKGIFPQAFCKIIPDILGGDPEYCNIMHADGAGTKSSLAYMYWKETGDLSVWKGIAQDALIMNTDDLLCVGAVDNILVSSTIGRNKMLIPGEVISAIINGTDEVLAQMREMGVGIYATGGETADVGDLVRTIIVDSTVTCRMKRSDVIDNANIRPGDVIVGLSSSGTATYEEGYNGGMGSNGLTSARHDVFAKYLAEKYPESYDHAVPEELVYSGSYRLTDAVEGSPVDAGHLVLSPTRTYAPFVKKMTKILLLV